jgi:hypothetical protein
VTGNGGGEDDERAVLDRTLEADRLYVFDRGYAKFALFNHIVKAQSSYVGRLRDNSAWEVLEERPLTEADLAAGILSDQIVHFPNGKAEAQLDHPIRVVCVKTSPHTSRGKIGGGSTGPGSDGVLRIGTNLKDVPAEIISLLYRYRWTIEIFRAQYDEKDNLYRRKWRSYIGPPRVAEVGTLVPASPAMPAFKLRSKPMRHVTDDLVPPRAQRSFLSVSL